MAFELFVKPVFTNQLRILPTSDAGLVWAKIFMLVDNPRPDAKNKKRLQGLKEAVFRIRAGDYRVLYTFDEEAGWVSLLKVERRDEVYDDLDEIEIAKPTFDFAQLPDEDEAFALAPTRGVYVDTKKEAAGTPLERGIDNALLDQLGILEKHRPALLRCKTIEQLVEAYLPEDVRNRVFDVVSAPSVEQVIDQPNLIVPDVDDLIRVQKGELIDFLLKLDPEQQRYVTRAISGNGPVLIKGGPGTGKSTIAIYRVQVMLELLRKESMQTRLFDARSQEPPKILFTTYTNALIAGTRQLLDRLLGEDAPLITVETADKLARAFVLRYDPPTTICDEGMVQAHFMRAVDRFRQSEPKLAQLMLDQLLNRFKVRYLIDEIEDVIVARNVRSRDSYQQLARTGRRAALASSSRVVIWRLHEFMTESMSRRKETSWARLRRRAADLVEQGAIEDRFDAIFIDEAQDLQPNILRMLVGICRSPDRLLLTADANQSIYGSGFNWSDVHNDLQFRGRTGLLRKNYRSTRQISLAAADYLREAGLDPDKSIESHVTNGPEPAVRFVEPAAETPLLVSYFKLATRDFRLGYSACAVLVPTEHAGRAIAEQLTTHGLSAQFMASRSLDLRSQSIKVLPYRSSKGLEFPIVALAGLGQMSAVAGKDDDELLEYELRERRALFVAMTRAMRGLLVLAPKASSTHLFSGFSDELWNLGSASA